MKYSETIASQCRYGDIAANIWGDWDILWESSEDDYQGYASILAKKDNKYCFYEWHYGSCSGCDTWEAEGFGDEDVEKEMRETAMWFDSKDELKIWLDMLVGNPISNHSDGGIAGMIDILSGGIRDRVNAIRKELGMGPLP
jgi:hypothetical protein